MDIAKSLVNLEESEPKFAFLKDVSFYRAIDYEDVVILVVGNKDKRRITQALIDWIKETYEFDEIIIIEITKEPRSVVASLIIPSKVLSLNEIFLATGDVQFRAIVPKEDKDKILFTKEELEELILELTGNVISIEFQ